MKCLHKSFVQFLIGWLAFLLLSFESSLQNLDRSPFLGVWFADIFPHSEVSLFVLLAMSLA